ncbi:unnamed protein product [Boreogadus saida]
MDAQPGTYGYTRAACTILTHLVCTIFTILITVLSRPGSSLFSWHPFLMTLAFSFFMTEAILVFSPHGSPFRMFPHKSKGRLHWVLQCLGLACAALGFVAIVYNKHLAGKAHFTSWHGLTGLVTVCVVGIQCLAAVSLIYPSLVKGWSLAKLKRYHAAAGLLTYLLGGGSLFLAQLRVVHGLRGGAGLVPYSALPGAEQPGHHEPSLQRLHGKETLAVLTVSMQPYKYGSNQ